jgi:hypothetical protein
LTHQEISEQHHLCGFRRLRPLHVPVPERISDGSESSCEKFTDSALLPSVSTGIREPAFLAERVLHQGNAGVGLAALVARLLREFAYANLDLTEGIKRCLLECSGAHHGLQPRREEWVQFDTQSSAGAKDPERVLFSEDFDAATGYKEWNSPGFAES